MLRTIMAAAITTIALSGAASAQDVTYGTSGICEKSSGTVNGPALGRDAVAVSAACVAVRGVVPGESVAPLSRQELISILLISTLQTMPKSRGL